MICSRCILDSSVPNIKFDERGVCNYCRQFDLLERDYPNDERGTEILNSLVLKIKDKGKNKSYDCVVGVSGGTDSTYMLHFAISMGLRPLAVHFDNGWNSEISASNINNCLKKLNVDLITYVINWEEMKNIHLAFIKAGLPWADVPTDIGIMSTLYREAVKNKIDYIFVGNNFRTEGRQPTLWTYSDGRQIKYINKKFGQSPLKTFPNLTWNNLLYYGLVRNIKMVRPYYYINYNKNKAKEIISDLYGWKDYGGHHYESIFTRFILSYWLPKKFNIDKRRITLSALIRSGEISREKALDDINKLPYESLRMAEDKEYVLKKLGITESQFEEYMKSDNKYFYDYPSYYPMYKKMETLFRWGFKYILPFKPLMTYDIEKV